MKCIGRTARLKRCQNSASRLFCHHHRLQPWLAFVATIGFIGALFGIYRDALEPWFKSFGFAATVSPYSLVVPLNTWTDHQSLTVHNPTDQALYAVWISVAVDEHRRIDARLQLDTTIEGPDGRKFVDPKGSDAPVNQPPDVILFSGRDPDATPALLLVIRSLAPRASMTFRLRSRSKQALPPTEVALTYRFTVLSESEEPDGFATAKGLVNIHFRKMPKGLTLNLLDETWMLILE